MKLIFITQKLAHNDPLMGFTHAWVAAFQKKVDKLVVITNELGEVRLNPAPVLYSLGKETGNSRFQKTLLLNEALRAESDADAVFCHQCPIYVLAGLRNLFLRGMPTYLWYAHGHLSKTARLASVFCNKVFTSSPYALDLYSHKKRVIGQGVDIDAWRNPAKTYDPDIARLVHVGRLSPVKNILPMILLVKELEDEGIPATLDLIGDPATPEDEAYVTELRGCVSANSLESKVRFLGGMSHDAIMGVLPHCDYTLNFSTSAALDKSLIETVAAGLIPVSYNQSFLHSLDNTPLAELYRRNALAPDLLADIHRLNAARKAELAGEFIAVMKAQHDLNGLVDKILREIKDG